VILLQVGSLELGRHEVTSHGHYQGPNLDQYRKVSLPQEGDRGHHRYRGGHVYPLPRNQRVAFVVVILQQILKFLEM
jgi:hypothetical protein